ncbi:protamine isoform X2 [Maniola jurtina]|uniref:protamine isoform X2 n=1 Tax=Maniola jurtina TaxID=191418 RepID=UPI001E68CA03|nr:protamine isoform X2 [Maniola jurtina]
MMHLTTSKEVATVSDVAKHFKDKQAALRTLPLPDELAGIVESVLIDDSTLGFLKRSESKLEDLLSRGMCGGRRRRRRSRCRRRRRRRRSCRRRRRSCRRRRRRRRSCKCRKRRRT